MDTSHLEGADHSVPAVLMLIYSGVMQNRHTSQIIGLDLIRTFAALFVMLHHLGFWIWSGSVSYKDGGFDVSYRWLAPYAWDGWIGVEIFFVLSGFVIAYSASHATPVRFARGRLLRLYPIAWICATITAITLAPSVALPTDLLKAWIKSLLIWPKWFWVDGSFWTLPIEIAFYSLIFLLLAASLFHRLDIAMYVLGSISTAANLYVLRLHIRQPRGASLLLHAEHLWGWKLHLLLLRHGIFFAIGALLWLCLLQRATFARIFAMAVFGVGAVAEIAVHASFVRRFTGLEDTWRYAASATAIWVLAICAIVASVRYNESLWAFIGHRGGRIIRTLGLMTYPLYLVHQQVAYKLIGVLHKRLPDTLSMALAGVAVIALSYLVVTWMEPPLRRALDGVLPGASTIAALPATLLP